jgi:hypothetical protein
MFNETICSYDIEKQHQVILNKYQEIVTATGSNICSQTGSGQCLFQLNQDFQPREDKCLKSILLMTPVKQIIHSCRLICEPIRKIPYWVSINDTTWGYLGPQQHLILNCLDQDPYNLTIGGISDLMWITLPCNCYTIVDGVFLFSPELWCHDNISPGAVPVKPLLEFSSVQIKSLQSHGLSEFVISMELKHLNATQIFSRFEDHANKQYSEIEEQLQVIHSPVLVSHWIIGIGLILVILIVICTVMRAQRRSITGNSILVLGGLLSSLPGVRGESYLIIGSIIIMAVIQLVVLCIFPILIYRLVLSLKRRRSCHSYRSTLAPEEGRYHLDLLIPYPSQPVSIKIASLSYPINFYKTLTDPLEFEVQNRTNNSELTFNLPLNVSTIWNKNIAIEYPIVVNRELPSYSGSAFLVYECN